MKNKLIKISLFLAIILIPWGVAKATDTKAGDSIYVAKDEIVSGNFFAAGNTITIDGTISGDLIAAAQTINVNGRVEGDIIVAGQNITINGEVGGNIRTAGNAISLNGPVARNLNAFGATIVLGNGAKIGWDALLAGASIEMRGTIDGSLKGHAEKILISGKIGKDANINLSGNLNNESLVVSPEAVINGDLSYIAKKPAKISDQANISGQVEQKVPETKPTNQFLTWIWGRIFAIFAALVVGLVPVFLGKKVVPKVLEKMNDRPFKVLLPGLIIMLVLPPIALLLLFTIIGIPLAIIIAAWWLIAVYVAKIISAIFIGQLIFAKVSKKEHVHLFWSLLLGVVICWLLFSIPPIGWILCLIATWFGLGGIYCYVTDQLRRL